MLSEISSMDLQVLADNEVYRIHFRKKGRIVFVIYTLLIPVFRILDTIQISDISQ